MTVEWIQEGKQIHDAGAGVCTDYASLTQVWNEGRAIETHDEISDY